MNTKMGIFLKENAGKPSEYTYYKPKPLKDISKNLFSYISNAKTLSLLENANRILGKLDSESQNIKNPENLIQISEKIEAVGSTKIEGTKTTIDDLYIRQEYSREEKNLGSEKPNDILETRNYINALREGVSKLNELPISTRYIKTLHKILLADVRGKHKEPGEYRKSQNWIGASLQSAMYVPPSSEHVNTLMKDWEEFWHNDSMEMPVLIKSAIAHYQFETIHPFLDGNGRMGRLLIQLGLIEKGILTQPILHISNFFENNRNLYYDFLDRVRFHNDLESWITFFLDAIIQTADNSLKIIHNINNSIAKAMHTVEKKTGSIKLIDMEMIEMLIERKYIYTKDLEFHLKKDYKAAFRLIKKFEELKLLEKSGKIGRHIFYRSLVYPDQL